ncbi:PREDICTED: interferon lambda receptor 1 isoform X2 [Chrysochloris asiatica]|uniref:Interferon lambda receptor 1 n=1 Tax=Chrysochloris asiatica TaxID=185453 RepID=A0A9B0TE23_CHRAS|nr:PREDICTED: interferon lambda receptor 1 isoform X2 [Chrysochloris asiatica]
MTGSWQWVLLLLFLLQSAPGRSFLTPPQNVTLFSRNFSVYLTWLPGPGNPQNVTYFVAYKSILTPKRWRKVKRCAGTKELMCSLMCLEKQDLYSKFKGRVQAVSPNAKSPWMESKDLEYLSEMEPAPPTLTFARIKEILSINATYQLPPCMPSVDLEYEVQFWKEGTGNKTRFPAMSHNQPVQILIQPATRGYHCLSARTVYYFITRKYSEFSKPICFPLEAPGISWPFLVLLLLLLPLLLVTAIGGPIWRSFRGNPWFQQGKMPQALELIRRVRPTAGVKTQATVQAGSDTEEEDTEEVSSQPYIKSASFLGQRHQNPQCPKADGVDLGAPQTLVQVRGSSAWDSSDRSWPSTVDSAFWDGAETACYLVKKDPGKQVAEDGHWEPLPRPQFSKDSASLAEPSKNDLSSWTTWGSTPAEPNLILREPLVSLGTLTFCWDSSPEEEEEESGEEWDTEDSGAGSCRAESSQRIEGRGELLGHYMAR